MENYANWKAGEVKLTYQRTHPNGQKVIRPNEVVTYIRNLFEDVMEHHECFFAVTLNRNNEIIGWLKVSEGGVASTVVDHKIVLQFTILTNASALIVAHNHPSGNCKPSAADLRLTESLAELCKLMDVTLLDHVIVTEKNHYSFADNNLIS